MNNHFVDRETESRDFFNIINECKLNTVIITASKSGIGKSTLSKKFLYQLSNSYCHIHVNSHQINFDLSKNEGEYLASIFSSFYNIYNMKKTSKKYKNRKNTFKYFIKHKCKKTVKKDIRKHQLDEILTASTNKFRVIALLIVLLFKKIFQLDYYDYNKYTSSINPQASKIQSDYIKYLLSRKPHCVCIDNLQNIDRLSFKCFEDWLCDTLSNKNIFILEYTLDDNENYENVIKIRDDLLSTGANITIYKLKKMSPEYAYEAIFNKYPTIEKDKNEILNYYNYKAKGNIRKIEDYVLSNSKNTNSDTFDPAVENINELCNESKLILAILSLHKGDIDFECILNIFNTKTISFTKDIQFCLTELVEKYCFTVIEGNHLLIKHASIIDAWNEYSTSFPTHNFIAYRELSLYYNRLLTDNNKSIKSVQILLDLYLKFEPIKIYHLIPYLKSIVYNNISPQRAWEYLKGFINSIDTKLNLFVPLIYDVIDWCCDLDLINEAKSILDIIENQLDFEANMRYDYCFCKINYLLCNYNDVIDYITRKKSSSQNPNDILYYNLFLIIAYRSTNNYFEITKIVKSVEENKSNQRLSAYGFFLRLAEVYMEKDSCINAIEDSIKFFKSNNITEQSAKSNISLSYIYAINGETKKALKALNTAESELGFTNALSYIFKVNRACINMLEGSVDYNVWDLLDSAELVVENKFSRLAIVNNKIVCCIEGINCQQSDYLEHKAKELLECIPDRHMHAIVCYNLYLMYKECNIEKANSYLDIVKNNLEFCKTLEIRIKGNTSNGNNVSNFLLKKPWHVCFLSCWEFDFITNQTVLK